MIKLFNIFAALGLIVLLMNGFNYLFVNTFVNTLVAKELYNITTLVISCGVALNTYLDYVKGNNVNGDFVLK